MPMNRELPEPLRGPVDSALYLSVVCWSDTRLSAFEADGDCPTMVPDGFFSS